MAWAIEEKNYSQRRACGLVGMAPRVYRYRSSRPDDVGLRHRLRKLAAERRRFMLCALTGISAPATSLSNRP